MSWLSLELERHSAWLLEQKELADPNCRTCRGKGVTKGYIAPSKTAVYACPCTGRADWQRNDMQVRS